MNPLPTRLTPDLVARLGEAEPFASRRFAEVFAHGSLSVELYAPRGHDPQTPHTRDEVYAVIAGRGKFVCDGETREFAPGELLFVPAGMEHRFAEFSDDFAAWVLFYGPEGGEAARQDSTR
ncbi:MAG: cupin domain-containing protein [Lysobacter sp.]|nr:MAG: cupin domain-containing protein [Lysobacter sp.]